MQLIYSPNRTGKTLRFFLSENYRESLNFDNSEFPSYLHKHNYAEIHMLSGGTAKCYVNGVTHTLCAGDVILIPAGHFHALEVEDRRLWDAFQVDVDAGQVQVKHFPPELIETLLQNWTRNEDVINYLVFLCNELTGQKDFCLEENRDPGYIISDFIDKNYYRPITLGDLAQTLHLSEMQTQRLVKKYTGKTFGKLLREYRIMIAAYLKESRQMTNEEIASYVGYSTYSGFWKACTREKGSSY